MEFGLPMASPLQLGIFTDRVGRASPSGHTRTSEFASVSADLVELAPVAAFLANQQLPPVLIHTFGQMLG